MNFSISDLAGEHTAITTMKTATAKWRFETELHSIEGLQERRPNAPAGGRSGFANWSRQRARWFKCSSLAKARPSHELRTEPYRRLSAKPISEPFTGALRPIGWCGWIVPKAATSGFSCEGHVCNQPGARIWRNRIAVTNLRGPGPGWSKISEARTSRRARCLKRWVARWHAEIAGGIKIRKAGLPIYKA